MKARRSLPGTSQRLAAMYYQQPPSQEEVTKQLTGAVTTFLTFVAIVRVAPAVIGLFRPSE